MNRHSLLAVIVVLSSRVASAQPAPTPAPAPEPAPAPAEPAPPAEPTPAVEPTPVTAPAVEPKKEEKPAISATYDGGIKLSADDGWYEMKISFRNQMRFESLRPLDDGGPDEFLSTFYIPRSRLAAEGHLFGPDNRYKLELAMGDLGSFASVKDMYIEKKLPLADAYLRFGQWKRPFNRSELVSDFASTFNERPFENEFVGGGRSQGISINNQYEKSPEGLEYALGLFNTFSGGGDRPQINTVCVQDPATMVIDCATPRPINFPLDFQPAIVARLGWNSPNIKGYSESDLEGGAPRWAVGGSYKLDLANLEFGDMSHGLELDTMIKAYGFGLEAGVAMMILDETDPQFGFYVQPSWFITPKHLEVAARFSLNQEEEVDAAGTVFDRNLIEARGALNYYFHGHTFKVASDFGFFMLTGDDPAPDDPDLQLRIMMQLLI